MRYQKRKTDRYCVGSRHRSATKNIYGDITSRGSKVLKGYCLNCKKNSMVVFNNTIVSDRLGDFFKNLGKEGHNLSKKVAKNVLRNSRRALDITANIATAAPSRNSQKVLSTLLEIVNFYHTGKGCYLGKLV